jgi:hypothetical protein
MTARGRCIECDAPADWPLVADDGTFEGWICVPCDKRRRQQLIGRRRRVGYWMKRKFGF